jgi:type IV pilus assembly protein PilY1
VKLYTESPGTSETGAYHTSYFDNTNISVLHPDYLISGYNDVIYPFNGNFEYYLQPGGCASGAPCSALKLTDQTAAQTVTARPTANISVPANWTVYPAATNAYADVDETNQDGNSTYIQNNADTNPVILDYAPVTAITTLITDVKVVVYATKWETSSQACGKGTGSNPYLTRNMQAVLKMGNGTVAAQASQSLNNTVNSYKQYTFTWGTNPVTGAAWTWDDIKGGLSTTSLLTGFGVQNSGTISNTCYPRITQVYLLIDATPDSSSHTYPLVIDTGSQSISGILDSLGSGVRFGFAQYATSNDGGRVLAPIDFNNMSSIADNVIKTNPSTNTPLAETEYELLNYFRQVSPVYNTSSTPKDYTVGKNTANDPYYYMYSKLGSAADRYVPCAKSYIILMTDGEPTSDTTFPSGTPVTDSNGNGRLDELALWGRTTDMRPGSCSGDASTWTFPCIPSTQNVVTYTIFLFGKGSDLLKKTAINGGFNGSGTTPPCYNTGSGHPTQDELKACYRYADGKTSGNIDPNTDPPLTYYEGSDAYELQTSLTNAIAAIMRRAASGTAVSVLTTSSRGVGSMIQAYFLPVKQEGLREVAWTGYTQNLWLDPSDNLREDTHNDLNLKLDEDNVIKLYFDSTSNETMAASFSTDALGNSDSSVPGSLASCTPAATKQFSDISYLWEGGTKLALKDPTTRTIFTSKKVINGSTSFAFSTPDFTVTNIISSATLSTALNPDTTFTSENIVRYVRGECLETGVQDNVPCGNSPNATYRDRRVTVAGGGANGNVWKLGDIISSTPKVLSSSALNTYHMEYGDLTYYNYITSTNYTQRSAISFVGANDGMLHAFRVGYLKDKSDITGTLASGVKALFKNFFGDSDTTNDRLGEEVWAYIPFNAFPYLKYLADPAYCHVYYNDLSVRLVDVSIGGSSDSPTGVRTDSSWRTLLIGGMRFGGACSGGLFPAAPPAGTPANIGFSSYYAIDITDPEHPVPLWEFSDPDMGYASTYPSIMRTGDKGANGYWYVAFGSGSKQLPKSGQDINRTTTGYVYILDVKTGALVKKIALDHNAIIGDILAVDAEKNYHSERLYFGTAYKSGTAWKGKLVNIAIPNQDLSASWSPVITYMFNDNYPFTASPDATKDVLGTTWVYAGSGKYFSDVDQIDTAQQIFLGLKDKSGIAYPLTTAAIDNKTNVTTTGTVTGTTTACVFDPGTSTFANKTLVTSISTPTQQVPSSTGWYLALATTPAAERSISRPLAVGGLVDFLTYVPSGDVCASGGNSYLYSVGYNTGVAPAAVSIRSSAITNGVTSGTVTVQKSVLLGPGAPPTGEAIIIPPPAPGQDQLKKKIQIATGVVVEAQNNPVISVISKVVSWLKK